MSGEPRRIRLARADQDKSWFDYFEWLAPPTIIVIGGAYAIMGMNPPLWGSVLILAIIVIIVVAVYASWSLDRQRAEEVRRHGPTGTSCEICGATVNGFQYDRHLWDTHPQEARALKGLSRGIVWWALGIGAAQALFVTFTVGWTIASTIAFLVAAPLIAVVGGLGICLQVLWPRRAAKARREWLKTHVSPLPLEMEQR